MEPIPDEATGAGSFAYFMIRLRIDGPAEASSLAGIVERLGTSRKQSFSDSRELLQLLVDWSHLTPKMQHGIAASNDAAQRQGSSGTMGLGEADD